MLRLTYAFPPSLSTRFLKLAHSLSLFPYTQTLPLFPLSLPRLQALSPAFSSMLHLRLPTTLFCQSYAPPEVNKIRCTIIISYGLWANTNKCAFNQQKCREVPQVTVMKNKCPLERKVRQTVKRKGQDRFKLTATLSIQKEPVNGGLLAGCSLPLEVDTDEKQDQKATINNSFCSKTKPAGTLGGGAGRWFTFHCLPLHPPCPPDSCSSNLMIYLPGSSCLSKNSFWLW